MHLPPDVAKKCLALAGLGPPPPAPLVEESEEEFQARVIALARRNGWRVYHTRNSRKSEAGWPDLAMCRPGRLLFAELKTETGRTTAAQDAWAAVLRDAGQDVRTWRPSQWAEISETLEG